MIADAIRLALSNVPLLMFVAAIVLALARRGPGSTAERLLAWLLLLAVGIDSLWAGVFHVFFPEVARAAIGWGASPFQYEIGVADIALGVVAIASFWRSPPFKSAVALYAIVFYVGVIVGHIREAVTHDDFAPDNFGLLLALTALRAILLVGLLLAVRTRPSAA
ncbi:DUF6790 family protein [Chenggangzhangella methanolivorans]|uniref:Uncharacterized protein n=1 Tax=Chenggangzhangella methanolivorans TaxID=1437009 RepID=A0A9E6R606_9HYPH|nr:DUF6790 family protein [Chenggangzhangella methanolivorans]QZN98528.1 hypothetical protein K6K41_15940 [Chenggangzhangella methanolivorans]